MLFRVVLVLFLLIVDEPKSKKQEFIEELSYCQKWYSSLVDESFYGGWGDVPVNSDIFFVVQAWHLECRLKKMETSLTSAINSMRYRVPFDEFQTAVNMAQEMRSLRVSLAKRREMMVICAMETHPDMVDQLLVMLRSTLDYNRLNKLRM